MAGQEELLGSSSSLVLDNLYCEEERWEEEEEEEEEQNPEEEIYSHSNVDNLSKTSPSCPPMALLEHDLFWEEEELLTLIAKEKHQKQLTQLSHNKIDSDSSLLLARDEAVEWMLNVNSHYRFSALTAILAINYFDRFISSIHFQRDKPWMIQLVVVTCLSLAAKVEETQVPLLLDFQACSFIPNLKKCSH